MEVKQHILVVDDDPTVLETICEGLLMHGFNVIPAKNPPEALHKIKNKIVNFALIDLDLGFPDMNGIELGHKLKSIIPEIIILIITGYHNVKIAVEATREHSYHHMIKPFQVDQLLTMFEQIKKENDLLKENEDLRKKIQSLEKEIRELNKISEDDTEESKYQSKESEKNRLHTMAVESYERQKKQKLISDKNKKSDSSKDNIIEK